MKKIIFLFVILFALHTQAQFGNRGGLRGNRNQLPQPQTTPKAPEFDVDRYVGFVEYEIEKVAKKTGVNLSSDNGKKLASLLGRYNRDARDIRRINSFTLKSTKEMVENYQQKALETRDYSNWQKIQKTMYESLKPVADAIKEEDKKLDNKLSILFSEKQYKKWLKHNKKINKVIKKVEE